MSRDHRGGVQRAFSSQSPEPAAPQMILCVRRATLEERLLGIPLGFAVRPALVGRLEAIVKEVGAFRPRPALEEDPAYLQIIVQGLVVRKGKPLALFRKSRRPQEGQFVETRHNAKIALAAGGHVELVESKNVNILRAALSRELAEELVLDPPPILAETAPLGMICTASRGAPLFQQVHLGVIYQVPAPGSVVLPDGCDEFDRIEFPDPSRLRELFPRLEAWGQLLASAILEGRLRL